MTSIDRGSDGGVRTWDDAAFAQAVHDAEQATARTTEATRRLARRERELWEARDEAERLRMRLVAAERELSDIRASRAFKAARRLGDVRARLRP